VHHKNRRWTVRVGTAEDVAQDVKKCVAWTSCTGFYVPGGEHGLLVLNDSTGPDAIQEYAIMLVSPHQGVGLLEAVASDASFEAELEQVESLTVSWIDKAKLAVALEEQLTWASPTGYGRHRVRVESSKTHHGECCA